MENENYWKQTMLIQRKQKDKFFKEHPQSPIPIDDKSKFKGLDYFPPDDNYKFVLELMEIKNKKEIKVNDSKGHIRDMIVWGKFHFKINNQPFTLQAYKSESDEPRLFVPFKDKTNGKETYGAGKYLDLNYEENKTKDGKWQLDFNNSTNPWCAYSEDYACPLVPSANFLDVEILAGEKRYALAEH